MKIGLLFMSLANTQDYDDYEGKRNNRGFEGRENGHQFCLRFFEGNELRH